MENFGEKMERKTFLSVFGWRNENKWWSLDVFSPGLLKSFFSKMERNLNAKNMAT